MGYYALAMALEGGASISRSWTTLAPAVAEFKARGGTNQATDLGLLLPHLGFAYQELGDCDKAIAAFERRAPAARRAIRRSPRISCRRTSPAKKYPAARRPARARRARRTRDDLRLARLEAQALRQTGKGDEAVSLAAGSIVRQQPDKPEAYVALAQIYLDTKRGDDAVKMLQDAQQKFPADTTISFELGAVLDKQKKVRRRRVGVPAGAVEGSRQRAALNYLGYMLAGTRRAARRVGQPI